MNTFKIKKRKSKPPPPDPEWQAVFEELCEVLQRLGLEVRKESGYFKGGLCMLEDRSVFFINRNHPITENIDLLTEYLRSRDTSGFFISPKIRAKLENIEYNLEAYQ